jgi:hypothetical protein
MTTGIVNLQNFDLTLTSAQFGTFTLRNYGENEVSITIEPLDSKNLNDFKIGALGDLLISKNLQGKNKLLTINVLRNTPDYARLQAIIAAEEAGQSIQLVVNAKDSLTKESYTSPAGYMQVNPTYKTGISVDDVVYTIILSQVVHIPPTIN